MKENLTHETAQYHHIPQGTNDFIITKLAFVFANQNEIRINVPECTAL